MEEKQDADVDDVDRESLVKEIELIRQTLGGASTRAHSDGDFSNFDNVDTGKDSDDSEDELGIHVIFLAVNHVLTTLRNNQGIKFAAHSGQVIVAPNYAEFV